MNWSKKKRFVRDVARGAVGTKADAMAANTSSFAIILAYCLVSDGWQWIAAVNGCGSRAVKALYPQQLR